MSRILWFCYGLAAYAIFLVTFLYAIGLVVGVAVPKDIDSKEVVPKIDAVAIDILLLSIFAIQHSLYGPVRGIAGRYVCSGAGGREANRTNVVATRIGVLA
jgi:hypothetical protein